MAAAGDSSLFCFYVAPQMRVDARRRPGLDWEPAVVTSMPGDALGMWEVSGGTGDSSWSERVRYDSLRPRRCVAAPTAGSRSPLAEAEGAPCETPAKNERERETDRERVRERPAAQNAVEICALNSDCDVLERRLAALEAQQATATAAAAPPATSADPLMNLVDVAANITHDDLRAELERHVSTARSAGVRFLVTPSMTIGGPRGVQQTLDLACEYPGTILACAGVHPFWAAEKVGNQTRMDGADCAPAAVETLRQVAERPEVRCIGECGLDFSKAPTEDGGYPAPAAQLRWFELQVSLAVELEKPLYLHERDAHEEFLAVLRPLHAAGMLPPCLIHAFTGSEEQLSAYRGLDFHIGVTGHLLRKKNPMVAWLPKHVPLSRLLIETDSPYMGFKGCRKTEPTENNQKHTYPNVPASLPAVLQEVARAYGLTAAEVAATTTENARRFFSI